MRFHAVLTPAGRAAADLRWRTTNETRGIAAAIVGALDAAGLGPAEIGEEPNDRFDPESAPPPSSGVREDVYLEVRLLGDGAPGVAVCEGGGLVATDALDGPEQDRHAEMVRFVRAVERATGWRLAAGDEEHLVGEAAYFGVGPDGTVFLPAQITEDELDVALRNLLPRAGTATDRPRPAQLLDSAALRRLTDHAARTAPAGGVPVAYAFGLAERSVAYSGFEWPARDDDDAHDDLMRLWSELGDDESGRPHLVRISVDPSGRASAAVHFDRLPVEAEDFAHHWEWQAVVNEMTSRAPRWLPDWARDAAVLFRAAGRNVPVRR